MVSKWGVDLYTGKYGTRYPEEIHLKRSGFGGCHFETVFAASVYAVMSFHLSRNWWEGERPATDLASFTESAKSSFFQGIIHSTLSNAIISEFEACVAQNNVTQEQP